MGTRDLSRIVRGMSLVPLWDRFSHSLEEFCGILDFVSERCCVRFLFLCAIVCDLFVMGSLDVGETGEEKRRGTRRKEKTKG